MLPELWGFCFCVCVCVVLSFGKGQELREGQHSYVNEVSSQHPIILSFGGQFPVVAALSISDLLSTRAIHNPHPEPGSGPECVTCLMLCSGIGRAGVIGAFREP